LVTVVVLPFTGIAWFITEVGVIEYSVSLWPDIDTIDDGADGIATGGTLVAAVECIRCRCIVDWVDLLKSSRRLEW
jgi:hypothetical protein